MISPGIFLRGIVALSSGGAPLAEGVMEVTYSPANQPGAVVVVQAELEAFEVDAVTYCFELQIPTAEQFHSDPVDERTALAIPPTPEEYTRSFTLNGTPVIVEESSLGWTSGTFTLQPADVRALYETVTLVVQEEAPTPTIILTPVPTPSPTADASPTWTASPSPPSTLSPSPTASLTPDGPYLPDNWMIF